MKNRIKVYLMFIFIFYLCGCQRNAGMHDLESNPSSIEKNSMEKQEIVVLVDGYDRELVLLGNRFNTQSEKYHVVFEEFSNVGKDRLTERNTRLISNEPMDMYFINGLDFGELSEQGVIVPIEEYMDMDMVRENYGANALAAWEKFGKLYSVPVDFTISVPVIRSNKATLTRGCTPEKFLRWISEIPDLKSENGIFNVEILRIALTYGLQNYVIWKNENPTFDDERFKEFIRSIDDLDADTQFYYDRWDEVVGDGASLFMEEYICRPSDINGLYQKYGEDLEFVGYPVENGELCCRFISSGLCLLQKSKNKEGAIEFLNYYLENASCEHLPTKKVALDKMIAQDEKDCKDETTVAEKIEISQLISHAMPVNVENEAMLDIITAEMKTYFKGERSLDETMKVISSRLDIYLAERMN